MNNHSIAVWLCLGGDERLTEAQLKFTVKLCRDIADHHKLGRDCIVSHGAARERSAPFEEYAAVIQDPALWRALAEKDLGYWVEDKDVPPVEEVPKNFDHIQALRKLGLKIDEKDKKYPLERALEVFNKQFLDRNEKELDDYGRCKLFALVKKKEQDDSVQKTAFVGQEFV